MLLTSTCNLRFVRLLDQGCLGSDREAHGGKDLVSSEDGWKVVKRKVRKSSNCEIVFPRAPSGSLFKVQSQYQVLLFPQAPILVQGACPVQTHRRIF